MRPLAMELKYEPALDGLRTVAILLVIAFHTHVPGFGNGRIGVDVFFVLSGYLITSILVKGPALGRFYVRRLRRLAPALLALVAVYLVTAPLLFPEDLTYRRDALVAATYLTDLFIPQHLGDRSMLTHTWSLALEMQFYLVWPFVLMLPRKWLPAILAVAWIALTAVRFLILRGEPVGTPLLVSPLRSSGLILGGLLALSAQDIRAPRWIGYVGLFLLAVAAAPRVAPGYASIGITLAEIAAVMLILALRSPGAITEILSSRPMTTVGILSYGLYLWHAPVADLLKPLVSPGLAFALTLAIGLGLAATSYFTVERWGRRGFGRQGPTPAVVT